MPGSPAWRAGLEPGDEIVKIGDRENPTFMQLKGGVTLGDMENGIPIVVRRAADGEKVELTLKPEQNQGRGLATIGILHRRSTVTLCATVARHPEFARRQGASKSHRRPPPTPSRRSWLPRRRRRSSASTTQPVNDYREFVGRTGSLDPASRSKSRSSVAAEATKTAAAQSRS